MTFIKQELYISEPDLFFENIADYISNVTNELLIISPYIKTSVLEQLLIECKANKITIITTWSLRDFLYGSSELKLYEFCKKNKIYLFLNKRVHLKVFINDYSNCIFGTANISKTGLSLIDNYNYELGTKIDSLDVNSIIYFKKILNESVLLTDVIYKKYKEEFEKLKSPDLITEPDFVSKSDFLISYLPMSYDINELFKLYSNGFESSSIEKRDCAIHDIILYEMPFGLNYDEFIDLLKERFFKSEFMIKLLDFIAQEDRYFGRVKEWIQNNCEDVPVPSRRDLTGNIQVLYKWIVELSDGKYKVDRPNHSERIYRVK